MSDLAATRSRITIPASSAVGLTCVLAAAGLWVLAGIIDDGLYALAGIFGIVAFAAGLKGRREARSVGGRAWAAALVAIVLGGLLGGSVAVAFVYFVTSHLVS